MITKINTRFKFKIPKNENFLPLRGEPLLIEDDNQKLTFLKVGDGKTSINELPKVTTNIIRGLEIDNLVLKSEYELAKMETTFSFELNKENWSKNRPYSQTVQIPVLLKKDKIILQQEIIDYTQKSIEQANWFNIDYTEQEDGLLTFFCIEEKPKITLKGSGVIMYRQTMEE